MYSKGDFIVHFTKGVCRVEDICMPDIDKGSDKRFYRLRVQGSASADIYSPIDGKGITVRPLMSACEAGDLISHMPSIAPVCVASEKMRKEAYRKLLSEPYPANLVSIIKTVYERAREKEKNRKKLAAFESEISSRAKELLYTEIGIALGIPTDAVEEYIVRKIDG